MGVPQLIHVNRIFPYKSTILGYPHLWKPPYKLTNLVPAPIAALRNLNIVQNDKRSFKGFKFVRIFRRASLFPFWAIGIVVFRTLYFGKKQEPNFLTRDILFEM